MKYKNIVRGEFISRPNRFIAKVKIDGEEHTVHVKNTGRCKEILVPGAVVYLERSENPERKTAYDLIAVEKKTENGKFKYHCTIPCNATACLILPDGSNHELAAGEYHFEIDWRK